MFESIENINSKEFLVKKIKENLETYGQAVVKAVLFREQDSIYIFDGRVNILYKSEKSSSFTYDYGKVILLQSVISIEDLLKLIESFSTDNIVLNKLNIKIKGGFVKECYHISNRYKFSGIMNDWPCWFSRFSYDSNLQIHYRASRDSLTAPGLPPYPDLYEANKNFLNLDDDSSPNQNTPIGIQFIIPDYRARIKTLEVAQNQVTIAIENKEVKIDDLLLQFFCKNKENTHHLKEISIGKNGISKIMIPFAPKEGHAYLLEKNSGKEIDSKSFGGWLTDRTEGIIFKTSKDTIESMITKGESETIEFKMDLGKDTNDFLESVVAFANTKGGTILLGVHDDRGVVGTGEEFEKLDKRIRDLVANRCEPNIGITIESFTIDNRDVVVVTVEEGNNKPYLLHNKGAYKRVIKDDYLLSRHDLDEIYSKKNTHNPLDRYSV